MVNKDIRSIAHYDIIETIQELPEWSLYKAYDNETKKNVLIKQHYPDVVWSDEAFNDLFNKLSALRLFEHPFLLPILDFGKSENTPYVVFAGEQEKPLGEFLSQPDVSSKQILGIFCKVAEGLGFLHEQDIIHGLLSPENILVDGNGTPRLLDYGLSDVFKKVLVENTQGGLINLSVHNISTTSPEQILGRIPTRRSDIYSFGLILYSCASGESLSKGKTDPEAAIMLLRPGEKWLRNNSRNLSPRIVRLLRKCLTVEPENRYKGFPEIIKVLKRLEKARRDLIKPIRKSSPAATPKKRFLTIVVSGGALIVIGGLAFLLWRTWIAPASVEQPTAFPTTASSLVNSSPTVEMDDAGQDATQEPNTVATQTPEPDPGDHKPALEGTAIPVDPEPITIDNIQEIQEFSRLGYGKPEDVAVSNDFLYFAVATSANVLIYDAQDHSFYRWIDPQGWATSVQFAPEGNLMAIGLSSGEIQIWDRQADTLVAKLSGHSARVSKLLYSKNGRYLYSASYDQNITIWDMQTNEEIRTIPAHSGPVIDMSVTDDGRMLASCSNDSYIRLWDLSNGTKLYEFYYDGRCAAVALSSDGEYLAAGGDAGIVQQWTVKLRQRRTDLVPVNQRIWELEYFFQDEQLFVGLENGNSRSLNAAQEKYPGSSFGFTIPRYDPKLVGTLGAQFEFDETYALLQGSVISILWNGTVKVGGKVLISEAYDTLDQLTISPSGSYVAASGKRGLTSAWNISTNQVAFRSSSGSGLPPGDPIAPDDSGMIIIVPKLIRLDLYETTYSEEKYQRVSLTGSSTIDLSDTLSEGTISYGHEGTVVISSNLGQSKAWDFQTGYEIFSSPSIINTCFITKSSNDGEILQVLSAAGPFPTWNDEVKNICLKSYAMRDYLLASADDLNILAYTMSNGYLEVYDPLTNKALWTYPPQARITAIAVSADGSIVAIGDQNGKLIFFDSKTGGILAETIGNFGELTGIEFSKDGNWIASAGSDGAVRLFGVPSNR